MGAGAAHHRQRILQLGALEDRHQLTDPLGRHGPQELVGLVEVDDVLEVQVAGRLPRLVHDHVPREAVPGDGALDLGWRRGIRQAHQRVQRDRDVLHLLARELERRGERARPVFQQPLAGRLVDDALHLVERERARGLVLRLDLGQAEHRVGDRVEGHDERLHDAGDADERRREQQGRPIRHGERDVLRHHLAQHHVQERDDEQRDDERDRGDRLLRQPRGAQRDLQQVVDRRLGHVEDQQRAHGDAELRRGEHERRVLHREQRDARGPAALLRPRLDLRPLRGDDRELGADEEGVDGEQHDERDDPPGVLTHGTAPSSWRRVPRPPVVRPRDRPPAPHGGPPGARRAWCPPRWRRVRGRA